jgi:hypothetical protein
MKMLKGTTLLLIILITLSGCIGDSELTNSDTTNESIIIYEGWNNQSYQFWNTAPMSIGNLSTLENSSGTINIILELTAFFHETNHQGFVNYTLTHNNDTVFSTTLNHSKITYYINLTNITNNLTVIIHSSGSDDNSTAMPGDFFIALAKYEVVE